MTVYFDESLPKLVALLIKQVGEDCVRSGFFLRDARAQLTFFSTTSLDEKLKQEVAKLVLTEIFPYAREDRPIADIEDPGTQRLFEEVGKLNLEIGGVLIQLIDRRIVGADWLQPPESSAVVLPARFAFMSLKGGVGRSTALSIAAAHLAEQGKRVLVIDLDMEAPGLGAMLLDDGTTPRFGILDGLIENGFGALDATFLADMVGPSSLSIRGKIDVVPAFGKASLENPGDVLAKISRAYMEDVNIDGGLISMRGQIRKLVDNLAEPSNYDVVLIDARAGLHESSAASVLGLSAEVFLFGLNEPQTFQGYAALLAHLRRLVPIQSGTSSNWPKKFSIIHAKAGGKDDTTEFTERWTELITKVWIGASTPVQSAQVPIPAEPFNNVPWVEEGSADAALAGPTADDDFGSPIPIYHDSRFFNFDPGKKRSTFTAAEYETAYGTFLSKLDTQLNLHK